MEKEKKKTPAPAHDRLAELEALTSLQEEVVTELEKELAAAKELLTTAGKAGAPVWVGDKEFDFEGKTYPFPAPAWRHPGRGKVTVDEAKNNPAILAELVELKAGNIV